MIVTAWKAGSFGFKVDIKDRDRYFDRAWRYVLLELEGYSKTVEANVDKASFWNDTCHELICKDIGLWLEQNQLAPWRKGYPPKIRMEHLEGNKFRVYKPYRTALPLR